MTAEAAGRGSGAVGWDRVASADTTVYLDTENVFHWAHPEPAGMGPTTPRARTLDEVNLAHEGRRVSGQAQRVHRMALGGAVFDLLTQWLGDRYPKGVDVRSYGKTGDPGVEVVATRIADRAPAAPAGPDDPGAWVHVGVGRGPDVADVEIAKDLADRSRRAARQTFFIVSSDHGETLSWANEIARGALEHEYRVIMGPGVLHPDLFYREHTLDRLSYAGTVSELFGQAVVGLRNGRRPRLRAAASDLSRQYVSQKLTGGRVQSKLSRADTTAAFVGFLRYRANTLDGLPGIGADEKLRLAQGWPDAVVAAWKSAFPDGDPVPLVARQPHLEKLIGSARGHVALAVLGSVVRRSIRVGEGEWVAGSEQALAEAEEARRAQLGPGAAGV